MDSRIRENTAVFYYRNLSFGLAVVTLLLAISVIIGWEYDIEWLIRYQAKTVAMAFNSALCFILLTFAIFFRIKGLRAATVLLTTLVFIIGTLAILQILFDLRTGLDTLLFSTTKPVINPVPGRIALNSGFNFIFLSLSLLLISTKEKYDLSYFLAFGMTLFTFFLTLIYLSGYLLKFQQAYLWGTGTPMAMNTAIVFLIFSASLASLIYSEAKKYQLQLLSILPISLSLALFLSSTLLAVSIGNQEQTTERMTYLPTIVFVFGALTATISGLLMWFMLKFIQSKTIADHHLALNQATLEAVHDGIIALNNRSKIMAYNQHFLQLWNLGEAQIKYLSPRGLLAWQIKQLRHPKSYFKQLRRIENNPLKETFFQLELKNGTLLECRSNPQILNHQHMGRIWVFSNKTEHAQMRKALEFQSTHDSLTGLPNRTLIMEIIKLAVESIQEDEILAIYILDLDRFSQINALWGRSRGDRILQAIARRYKALHCLIGHLGGDEFIILKTCTNLSESSNYAQTLINVIARPIRDEEDEFIITASIGISLCPRDDHDLDVLLNKANIALTQAKKNGRNTFTYFTNELKSYSRELLEMEAHLKSAMENEEFILHYQPVVNLKSGKLVGLEALIRWQHPDRGLVPPEQFIPLAEEIGLVRIIGEWVLLSACKTGEQLIKLGLHGFTIAVNISAPQFNQDNFAEKILQIIYQTAFPPEYLEIELTESILFGSNNQLLDGLMLLKSKGISIVIDDFGTGYSNLNYLNILPIDKIKIDKSFIQNLGRKTDDGLVKTIIALGHNLDIHVLAEGIETEQQALMLKNMGCEFGQGFLYSKPLSLEQLRASSWVKIPLLRQG